MKNAKIVFLTFLPLLWEITTKRTHAKNKIQNNPIGSAPDDNCSDSILKQLRQKKCKKNRYCRYHTQR